MAASAGGAARVGNDEGQAMATTPHDLVVSYVVDQSGKSSSREALDEALRQAYRVVEVLCVPGQGCMYVTVVLTHDEYETAYGERQGD
jgi:hypothetical protein